MKQLLITIAAVVLVGCGSSVPDNDLQEAAGLGNIEAVKQHLAAGVDVNGWGDKGNEATPLYYAAQSGHKEIAELLIGKGADVDAKDDLGLTSLYHAVIEEQKEIAELLIAKGADVNAKNNFGETPLTDAADPEITDLLRKHGTKTAEELEAEGK